jgi:hypothetical protein
MIILESKPEGRRKVVMPKPLCVYVKDNVISNTEITELSTDYSQELRNVVTGLVEALLKSRKVAGLIPDEVSELLQGSVDGIVTGYGLEFESR